MTYFKDIKNLLDTNYPGSEVYVMSDHHFFHKKIIDYTRSNFTSLESMHEYIIKSHNDIITDKDVVIFLGDYSFYCKEIANLNSNLKGKKILLMGNHDDEKIISKAKEYGFDYVFNKPVKIGNIYMSHPALSDSDEYGNYKLYKKEFEENPNSNNYHGHIHEDIYINDKSTNCSGEVLDYKPMKIYTCEVRKNTNHKREETLGNLLDSELIDISKKKILLEDYYYTFILEKIKEYFSDFYLFGSYLDNKVTKVRKKTSDLDITFLYDEKLSKNSNIRAFKEANKKLLENLNNAFNIQAGFLKNMPNLFMMEVDVSESPFFSSLYVDINKIDVNIYKESDFNSMLIKSEIENIFDSKDIYLPGAEVKVINQNVNYISRLIKYLFQTNTSANIKEYDLSILKKRMINIAPEEFNDIFLRYSMRNILLLNTFRREKELQEYSKISLTNGLLPDFINNYLSVESGFDKYYFEFINELINTKDKDLLVRQRLFEK